MNACFSWQSAMTIHIVRAVAQLINTSTFIQLLTLFSQRNEKSKTILKTRININTLKQPNRTTTDAFSFYFCAFFFYVWNWFKMLYFPSVYLNYSTDDQTRCLITAFIKGCFWTENIFMHLQVMFFFMNIKIV